MIFLNRVRSIASLSAAACTLLFSDPLASNAFGPGYYLDVATGGPPSETAAGTVRLKACGITTNCVSSNYLEPPNRYFSPLLTVKDRSVAFQNAVKDLQSNTNGMKTNININSNINIVEVIPKNYYIHLTVPGTAPNSLDDIELVFLDENGNDNRNIVNVRCEARVTLPPPPFCIQKNCINGNMDQRKRLEDIGFRLGLPSADEKQMRGAKWTPIFFNSDRVPNDFDYFDD